MTFRGSRGVEISGIRGPGRKVEKSAKFSLFREFRKIALFLVDFVAEKVRKSAFSGYTPYSQGKSAKFPDFFPNSGSWGPESAEFGVSGGSKKSL